MSVTPNFSWPLIEPTDFVTNLPADLETLADDIDADVWAIKGTADAALPETIIDAAGDLIYGSAADTAARLAIGTAGQVLKVNSGATAPEWGTISGGAWTVLASGNLPAASTLDLTSISGSYRNLRLIISDFHFGAGANDKIKIRLNATTSSSYQQLAANTTGFTGTFGNTSIDTVGSTFLNNGGNTIIFDLPQYASTTIRKPFQFINHIQSGSSTWDTYWRAGAFNSTSAISEINIFSDGAASFANGTYLLLGEN